MLLFIIIFLFFNTIIYCDDDWCIQNPIPTGKEIVSIYFADSSRGWALESWGKVLYTSNGGECWNHIYIERMFEAGDMFFTDILNGWIAGDSGTILHTSDGGKNWEQQNSGKEGFITKVFFLDKNTGWALANHDIIYTENGGKNWELRSFEWFDNIFFVSKDTGWCINENICFTTDGGRTWNEQFSGTDEKLKGIYFIDSKKGWVVGDNGIILNTSDGGETWNLQDSGSLMRLGDVFFTDNNNGWAVGHRWVKGNKSERFGILLNTKDGGKKWDIQFELSGLTNFRCVYFTDYNKGWFVEGDNNIYHTLDGGNKWHLQSYSATEENLLSIFAVNKNKALAVGENGVIVGTNDGGTTWKAQNSNVEKHLHSVYFVNDKTGYAVGDSGTVIYTQDGGDNWEKRDFTKKEFWTLTNVFFIYPDTGWVSGWFWYLDSTGLELDTTSIFKTIDGGKNWKVQFNKSGLNLSSIYFTDANNGWFTGSFFNRVGTVLYYTSDGGTNWSSHPQIDTMNFSTALGDICFSDYNNGWIAGARGFILKTEDGGKNWIKKSTGIEKAIKECYFIDNGKGWLQGREGGLSYIFYTEDFGDTWVKQTPEVIVCTMEDIHFSDSGNGWLVGWNGEIWHHSKDTVTDIIFSKNKSSYNKTLTLSYNPFKSFIKINYSLHKNCWLNISVYSILGKKIHTLINGFKNAGSYGVFWYGRSVSGGKVAGGVYFLTLSVNGSAVSKKITIIR